MAQGNDDRDVDLDTRRVLIFIGAACQTAIDQLEPDDLYHELVARLHEICDLGDSDLGR